MQSAGPGPCPVDSEPTRLKSAESIFHPGPPALRTSVRALIGARASGSQARRFAPRQAGEAIDRALKLLCAVSINWQPRRPRRRSTSICADAHRTTHRFPRLPGCRRAFRSLRRSLRCRDPDWPVAGTGSGVRRGARRPGLHRGVQPRPRALRWPSQPDLPCRAIEQGGRRRAHPAQARGPEPYRRAQDQQHHRPGAVGIADGQDPDHRRDRRRPARRGVGDGRSAPGAGVRRVHGRDRHRTPEDQRLPHAIARRDRSAGHQRLGDAQGRAQRGDARLGHQRAGHVLHHRHRRWPGPVSAHGPRLQCDRRSRGARADAGRIRPPAGRDHRLCRRRQQRDRPVPRVPQ